MLTGSDVELRVAQIQQTNYGIYAVLLAYKSARVDMSYLDEIFGPMNWSRSHSVIDGRLFCTVSIWDEDKQQWVSKQDVGVPSNTEATKGEASDAFKRACFCWGIGRELYSAPDIRIKLNENEVAMGNNGKPKTYAKFYVADDMTFDKEQNCFTKFTVLDKDGNIRYSVNKIASAKSYSNAETENRDNGAMTDGRANTSSCSDANQQVSAICCQCYANIRSQKVLDYALKRFGKAICYDCQKKIPV